MTYLTCIQLARMASSLSENGLKTI